MCQSSPRYFLKHTCQTITGGVLSIPLTISTPELVPIRLAPASIILMAVFLFLIPPEALTPYLGPTIFLIRATSSRVAPPVEKPVEVLTKRAPAFLAARQAIIFSSSVRRQVSIITLRIASLLRQISDTVLISFIRVETSLSFNELILLTISISPAPCLIQFSASSPFTSLRLAPSGKPTTEQTRLSVFFNLE